MKPMVFSIDIDGTLTHGSAWTEDECLNAKPNLEVIKRVNELSLINFIVIHTARRHELYLPTIEWLSRNNVRYHAVCFGKMPCDRLFDLDAVNNIEALDDVRT